MAAGSKAILQGEQAPKDAHNAFERGLWRAQLLPVSPAEAEVADGGWVV